MDPSRIAGTEAWESVTETGARSCLAKRNMDQCRKIEERIAHYREMASSILDRPTPDSRLDVGPFITPVRRQPPCWHNPRVGRWAGGSWR